MIELVEKIARLQNASGSIKKTEILREFRDDENFRKFLYYLLNPMLTYKVSENTLRRYMSCSLCVHRYESIFEVCEQLSQRKAVDDETIKRVCTFIRFQRDQEIRELFVKLLSKSLKLGITAKTVNKVIPGLIPEWEVQQAYPLEKHPISEGTEFWLTEKLNGVRATYYNGQLIARSGVPFKGLDHIIAEIEQNPISSFVLDGELTLKDTSELSDNEAFRVATGILNSDDVHKTAICYTVFDIIPYEDFCSNSPTTPYSDRRRELDACSELIKPDQSIRVLPVLYHGSDQGKIDTLLNQMVAEDKEGLMLNTNVPYKRKRHKGILKIKRFYTMDLKVIGCEEGTGRLEGTLGALVLEYKGNIVYVGSGFTDEQRTAIWNDRDGVIGALCEVKYKEISKNKDTGLESLQFPVFVQMRFDKDQVSYG